MGIALNTWGLDDATARAEIAATRSRDGFADDGCSALWDQGYSRRDLGGVSTPRSPCPGFDRISGKILDHASISAVASSLRSGSLRLVHGVLQRGETMKFVLPMRLNFRRGTCRPLGELKHDVLRRTPPSQSVPSVLDASIAGIKARDAGQISKAEFGRIEDGRLPLRPQPVALLF